MQVKRVVGGGVLAVALVAVVSGGIYLSQDSKTGALVPDEPTILEQAIEFNEAEKLNEIKEEVIESEATSDASKDAVTSDVSNDTGGSATSL